MLISLQVMGLGIMLFTRCKQTAQTQFIHPGNVIQGYGKLRSPATIPDFQSEPHVLQFFIGYFSDNGDYRHQPDQQRII
jgi:hypothetical protein